MKERIETNDNEKISAGILFVKNKKILLCHVTGKNHWDIPKGQRNEGEDYIDAAIRECEEETGMRPLKEDLRPLGIVGYNRFKSLALFLYTGDDYPLSYKCKCTSMTNEGYPEVDDFEYFPLTEVSEYTVESLRKAIFNSLRDFYPSHIDIGEFLDTRESKINYQNKR